MNRNKRNIKIPPNPVLKANIISRMTFWWLRELFYKGYNRKITDEDIYANIPSLDSKQLTDKISLLWKDEIKRKNPNVLRMLFRAHGIPMICFGLLICLVETSTRILQPLFLGELVQYFSEKRKDESIYYFASGIIITSLIPVLALQPYIFYVIKISTKMRLSCSALIYKKCIKIRKNALTDGLNGKVITLLSNDLTKFDLALLFVHDLWKGPLETILLGYFMYREIGISAIIGVAFMLSFIPLQAWGAKKAAGYRQRTAERTDLRVKLMNEIIQGIQVIKMYAWENPFANLIDKVRRKEINAIKGTVKVRAGLYSTAMISRFSLFFSLVAFVYLGDGITARRIFIISSYFTVLNESMVHFWPMAITFCAEGYISTRRVKEFLLENEGTEINLSNINKTFDNGKLECDTSLKENKSIQKSEIIFKNVSAFWEISNDKSNRGINNINITINEPKLYAIIGPVGGGKSTLLNVILKELPIIEGSLSVNGRISYAAQEPWLFESSIKSNILFVEDYNEERYNNVIHVCALEKDFELFTNGDETIVGERGISLSGGQKARINLARAIYKESDIYLLDDPLSAVDTQVGKHIFEMCIKNFLNNKICILVTHQVHFLREADCIFFMNSSKIDAIGTYQELSKITELNFLNENHSKSSDDISIDVNKTENSISKFNNKKKSEHFDDDDDRKEFQAEGSVRLKVYKLYFKALQNSCIFFSIIFLFIAARIALSGVDYFLSRWVILEEIWLSESINNNNSTNSTVIDTYLADNQRENIIIIYTAILLIALFLYLSKTYGFFFMCLRISLKLHDKLFRGIIKATMYFFNMTPSGRILNRFSKDISGVDSVLPSAMEDCLTFLTEITAALIIVIITNYWLAIPAVIVSFFFYIIRIIYTNTSRSIKRIESMTRSPICSHTNQVLQGLTTIRAFNAQEILEYEFHEHQNKNTSAWFLFISTNRAFALWLDIICIIYIGVVTFSFLLLSGTVYSGDVGLAIMQSINMVGMCQWGIRQTAELENQMTSVERIVEYIELPSEPMLESNDKNKPPSYWPKEGNIKFQKVFLRYSINTPYVLRDINFEIKSKEKIGVVGRTGAGKSSIIQAIFRLAILEGSIIIDDININTLNLHDVRSRISIIPQDPVLFSGTLRYNLDPFEQSTENEMWQALEEVELKTFVTSLDGGLYCKISGGGTNLSSGQRQLLCLARAIIRNNNILILDEATANVDSETDKLIQKTIRNKFAHCTVITIAHRLHTIMDSNRVLVIDSGRIAEYDHPYILLQNKNGFLRKLLEQNGQRATLELTEIAKINFKKYN